MLNKVIKIERRDGYRLRIGFSDSSEGVHDFANLVAEQGEMIAPLRDPAFFGCVFHDCGVPTWPNGVDFCPDWLKAEMAEERNWRL
jgi:hypothetical protein